MKTETFKVEGMSCGHCVMSVKKELGKLPNVTVEDVQIGSARLRFDESKVTREDVAKAVEEAGYQLV